MDLGTLGGIPPLPFFYLSHLNLTEVAKMGHIPYAPAEWAPPRLACHPLGGENRRILGPPQHVGTPGSLLPHEVPMVSPLSPLAFTLRFLSNTPKVSNFSRPSAESPLMLVF